MDVGFLAQSYKKIKIGNRNWDMLWESYYIKKQS